MRDGTPCGTIGVTEDGTVYGFGPFLLLADCDPGDILVVELDLSDRKATLIPGDEELLDAYGAGRPSRRHWLKSKVVARM
jgi:hypothetical protein